jgi:hypothetical protein
MGTETTPPRPDGVRTGGLMRCCLETLDGYYPDGPAAKASDGDVLSCKHCRSSMIFSDGSWKWNHE